MKKKTYKISGMHCTSCAMVIESDLEDAGIKASCNYARETLEVEIDGENVNEEKIQTVVQHAGYNVVAS